jgi:hypothetical protein
LARRFVRAACSARERRRGKAWPGCRTAWTSLFARIGCAATSWRRSIRSDAAAPPAEDLGRFGVTEADLRQRVSTQSMQLSEELTLAQIIQRLRNTYCRSIGVEYMHIQDTHVRRWLQ